jgi:hypothetical protein
MVTYHGARFLGKISDLFGKRKHDVERLLGYLSQYDELLYSTDVREFLLTDTVEEHEQQASLSQEKFVLDRKNFIDEFYIMLTLFQKDLDKIGI